MLGETKRGPALRNRLVGEAEVYRGLKRESVRATNGIKYFRDTLRHHFIEGAQSVFLWRFHQFTRATRGNIETVKWIGKFSLLLKRLREAWMDVFCVHHERREEQYHVDVTQLTEERRRNATALDPNLQETRDHWYAIQVTNHERLFPFSDNLTTLMFIVASELSEALERDSQVPFLSRE